GIRYYLARAGDPSHLVAPPYDVIPESDVAHYRSLSPYNVVHLTRPGTDYEGAARTFERWLDDRILEPESRSMYVHEVEFEGRVRRDLIASLRLQSYSDRIVLPHERTHQGPKEDRLALLRATRVSLEPLWFLYEGAGTGVPSRFTLALLTDLSDPGLVVLPTHRVMKTGIPVTGGERKATLEEMLGSLRGQVAAGAYRNHQFQVLPLDGEVALVELHEQVIDNILGKRNPEEFLLYTRDPAEAVRWVDEGVGTAAFFLDAPDLRQVLKLAQEGKTLPQKATYFHPKPPSGMVFDRLERDRRL